MEVQLEALQLLWDLATALNLKMSSYALVPECSENDTGIAKESVRDYWREKGKENGSEQGALST